MSWSLYQVSSLSSLRLTRQRSVLFILDLCSFYMKWEVHNSSLFTGKKNKLRVYYLSWLRNRILHNDPEVEKKQGWITVGDLEGCVHYKVGMSFGQFGQIVFIPISIYLTLCLSVILSVSVYHLSIYLSVWKKKWYPNNIFTCICCSTVKYERIKFLVIALKNAVEIYAWAPKPYHKFMAFKVRHMSGPVWSPLTP